MGLNPLGNATNSLQGLLQMLLAGTSHSIEGYGHLGIDYELADLVHLRCRRVFIVGRQHPAFVSPSTAPTSTQNGGFNAAALHKSL